MHPCTCHPWCSVQNKQGGRGNGCTALGYRDPFLQLRLARRRGSEEPAPALLVEFGRIVVAETEAPSLSRSELWYKAEAQAGVH